MPGAGVQSSSPPARDPAHVPRGKCTAPSAPACGGHGAGSWQRKGGQADVDQGFLLLTGRAVVCHQIVAVSHPAKHQEACLLLRVGWDQTLSNHLPRLCKAAPAPCGHHPRGGCSPQAPRGFSLHTILLGFLCPSSPTSPLQACCPLPQPLTPALLRASPPGLVLQAVLGHVSGQRCPRAVPPPLPVPRAGCKHTWARAGGSWSNSRCFKISDIMGRRYRVLLLPACWAPSLHQAQQLCTNCINIHGEHREMCLSQLITRTRPEGCGCSPGAAGRALTAWQTTARAPRSAGLPWHSRGTPHTAGSGLWAGDSAGHQPLHQPTPRVRLPQGRSQNAGSLRCHAVALRIFWGPALVTPALSGAGVPAALPCGSPHAVKINPLQT